MISLGLDSSSRAGSAAIFEEDRLIWEGYLDCGNTHSCTLIPLIQGGLALCGKQVSDLDVIYYSKGPGSFTGLRIGAAAVKGLTFGTDIQVKGVSTLLGLAYNLAMMEGDLFAVLDARASQVYGALFHLKDGVVTRITEDDAIPLAELPNLLPKGCMVVGDGVSLVMKHYGESLSLKPAPNRYGLQRASSVVLAGMQSPEESTEGKDAELSYIRRPQAERERLATQNKQL